MASARLSLVTLAIAFTLFVIYGSLVPLHYQHHSWQDAYEAFRDIRHLNLGIGSRADWVANILLFVPLAFLWLGTLWHSRNIVWCLLATLAVLLACSGLSLAIEFTQIFFPPRTVSLNDIYAETLGAFIGISLWWLIGASVTRWYVGWRTAEGPVALAQRLFYGYLFLLFGYNLLPLDLTLSPVELYHKWHEGRVILIPFILQSGSLAQQVYALLADVLIWIPAGVLARLATQRATKAIWNRLTIAAALLEFFQFFVYTRVTDTADILTGSLGAAIGLWLASRWHTAPSLQNQQKSSGSIFVLFAGIFFWLTVVYAVFWYPFDFQTDGTFLSSRLTEATSRVPFSAYYFGTEYRAVTEVLHKVGFFFPLGMLFASLACQIHFGPPAFWKIAALAAVVIVAGSVEAGQLFLPGKNADLTDWVLEMVGGWAGWALAWRIRPKIRPARLRQIAPSESLALSETSQRSWLFSGGIVLGLALLLMTLTHLPAIPYNIRELVSQDHPLWSAIFLACAIAWIFGFPAWAAVRMVSKSQTSTFLPGYILLHDMIAWVLLRMAVPLESIHDIVGSPVLDWPWEWELIGRFIGLFTFWSAISFGASLISLRSRLSNMGSLLWTWAIATLTLLPVAYFVVILQASTDNITELLAESGSPTSCLWVAAGLFVLALAGSRLAFAIGSGMRTGAMQGALWSIASLPFTYLALRAGFESYIIKYDHVYSAFQFILSQDRSHYATPMELLLRYGFAHTVLLLIIATTQAPYLSSFARYVRMSKHTQTSELVRREGSPFKFKT